MTKIDILMPYWGKFELAKQTVDSVLAQTSDNWNLTIVDDCYPDDSLRKYCKSLNNSKIKYIRHNQNIGITNNFNFCVKQSKNEFCVIIGCDDRFLPNFVETALKNIKNADFYQPNVEIIDAEGKKYLPLTDRVKRILRPKKSGLYYGENLATSLCHGNWLYFPSIVWKTKTIKKYKFNNSYKIAEDLSLELNLIIDGAKLFLDNTTTFQYRRFSESLSSKEKTGVRFLEEEKLYIEFSKKFKISGWHRAKRAANLRITARIHKILSSFLRGKSIQE